MLLAIDVGNTNTVLGLYRPATPEAPAAQTHCWRIATPVQRTLDELRMVLRGLFIMDGVDITAVTGVAVSSVVPPIDSLFREVIEKLFGVKPLFVEPGVKTGLPVLVDNPAEVGADRIVNCVAAFERYGGPTIVVDLGTATTFDVISQRGEYLGGAIAPGIGISADALFERAAKLGRVNIRKPSKVIGTNTVDHIQIGLYYGYIGLVDGICERMIADLAIETKVIATGGFARMLAETSRTIRHVDENLTLDGVRLIYERNQDRVRRRAMAATQRSE
ncbi:type III pantothenate kinase [Terriglobus roseus]|uniref:Type III pantothenate kinase n=1 Tax=Terriglobus roseus TaxID=392734 RepID=A0A1G7LT59_9BACT|nr:type III pantothenate kinase [Terriglobus roseus]SDF52160.1 pantothenate kinase [Terriglobus roseus]